MEISGIFLLDCTDAWGTRDTPHHPRYTRSNTTTTGSDSPWDFSRKNRTAAVLMRMMILTY
ncbi:MAG: hypothetical protein ACTSRK_04885 [Promethearchaeota archaeon]